MNIRLVDPKTSARHPEVLGVGVFEDQPRTAVSALPAAVRARVQEALSSGKCKGSSGEVFAVFVPGSGPECVFLIGLGKRETLKLERVRLAAARLRSQAAACKYAALRLDLESVRGALPMADVIGAAVEGLRMSAYRFDKYKTSGKDRKPSGPSEAELGLRSPGAGERRALAEAEILAETVNWTRDFANEPANVLTPVRLAAVARRMASEERLSCRVLGRAECLKLGMGGIIGVSQGSSYPPQLIVLEYKPKGVKDQRPVVLVGKGVTFDTGGISLKPGPGMEWMKYDMCGAAAVIGALRAIARLKLPVPVVGLAPVVENMPGSKAQRPGDIIRCMNGKTVEVLNTDAEGRLILADALCYAERYKPRHLIDIATLTGACSVTFGDAASAVMSSDPELTARLKKAGEHTGERLWEMPLYEEYKELIRATHADIQNISKKNVGIMTAGLFLREFSGHAGSWAHLDIAGTGFADGDRPLGPKGVTGMGVRLFTRFVRDLAAER
ncbi:MAG: Cytosol aminopeptidase [Candidatus Omnitrophica bacterium]|nr:Cytosol aminopeptidase [Candidatus Omnitrophota bacterium]